MSICDDILEASVFGRPLVTDETRHAAACPRCSARLASAKWLSDELAADVAPTPPSSLAARVVHAAAPLLAQNARRAAWRPLVQAVGAALVPLPAILLIDAYVLHAIYDLLSAVLPPALSFYLVVNYAGLLGLLFALTYGAIPLLAERQARLHRRVIHA